MTFGEILKENRQKMGLSQQELGEQIGVSFQTISKWESSTAFPSPIYIPDLASVLEVEPYELNVWIDEQKRQNEKDGISLAEFARALRLTRRSRGLSQRDLSGMTHIPVSTIGAWEKGISLPLPLQRKTLCTALEVEPEMLFKKEKEIPALYERNALVGRLCSLAFDISIEKLENIVEELEKERM